MDKLWDRIETALANHAPAVLASLNPPASAQEIAKTERLLNVRLPKDVVATYLRHDGQSEDSVRMFEDWRWLPLADVYEEWKRWMECLRDGYLGDNDNGEDGLLVRNNVWNRGWIPLTKSEEYDHHCLDLAPGPRGTAGQMFEYWYEHGLRKVVARSFEAWLTQFADELEADDLMVSDESRGLCRRGGFPFKLPPGIRPEQVVGYSRLPEKVAVS